MPRHVALPLLLLVAVLGGCSTERTAPPRAEFLVGAGDSIYWVHSDGNRVSVRGSPLLLARFGGRFYEVYVTDDDRSYYDAVLVGQRLYRRDLVTGDSMLVFQDSMVAAVERAYRNVHPDDERLRPDEEGSERPRTTATAELEIVGLHGPWLSYEYHADLDIESGLESHTVRRGVIDLRSGREASVAVLFGDTTARRIVAEGRRAFEDAIDSVLSSHDDRAERAADAVGELEFDSASFGITDVALRPAIQFVATGRGGRAGGIALPLEPIIARATAWWEAVVDGLPLVSPDSTRLRWPRTRYSVNALVDSGGDSMLLTLADSAGTSWTAARLPAGAGQIFWLDEPALDSASRRALARAFDEAVFYSDEARSASLPRRVPAPTTPFAMTSGTVRPAKPVSESSHETSEIMMPQHANNLGHVFGGVILSMMDRTAAVSAIRHARNACVTVSIDRVDFREPIHTGDLVIMKSSVNYVGRTSMEVGVRVEAEDMVTGKRRHTNSCYLTFVAVDRNGRPMDVPALIPETEDEKRRFAAAQDRRRRRLEERAAEEKT